MSGTPPAIRRLPLRRATTFPTPFFNGLHRL